MDYKETTLVIYLSRLWFFFVTGLFCVKNNCRPMNSRMKCVWKCMNKFSFKKTPMKTRDYITSKNTNKLLWFTPRAIQKVNINNNKIVQLSSNFQSIKQKVSAFCGASSLWTMDTVQISNIYQLDSFALFFINQILGIYDVYKSFVCLLAFINIACEWCVEIGFTTLVHLSW